jgi:hypothetical protein
MLQDPHRWLQADNDTCDQESDRNMGLDRVDVVKVISGNVDAETCSTDHHAETEYLYGCM